MMLPSEGCFAASSSMRWGRGWDVVWSLLYNIAQGFYLCKVILSVLRQHWTVFFPVHCCLEPQGQHCIEYLPMQCYPRSIKTTLNRIFLVRCGLEPLRQHCTRFLPVPCSPKSIKVLCYLQSEKIWVTILQK